MTAASDRQRNRRALSGCGTLLLMLMLTILATGFAVRLVALLFD